MEKILTSRERGLLIKRHRKEKKRQVCDQIKAVLLYDRWYSYSEIGRQEAAGVTHYVWRTSLDERVRSEHRQREGKVFRWDAGDCPGFDVGCRCWAEPVVD